MKKVRVSQTSISINSYAELSKTQFFPVTVVKVAFVMFGYVSKKFRKLESLHRGKKALISINLKYFHCLSHGLYNGAKIIFKILFYFFDWHHQIEIRERSIVWLHAKWTFLIHRTTTTSVDHWVSKMSGLS